MTYYLVESVSTCNFLNPKQLRGLLMAMQMFWLWSEKGGDIRHDKLKIITGKAMPQKVTSGERSQALCLLAVSI